MAGKNRVGVVVDSHFTEWGVKVERELQGAMNKMLNVSEAAAKQAESYVRTGDMRSGIHVSQRPTKMPWGLVGSIGDSDWKSNWGEKGTKAHSNSERKVRSLTAKGTARRKAKGLVSGIKGLHFLRKGIYANQIAFFEDIRLRIERVRTSVR